MIKWIRKIYLKLYNKKNSVQIFSTEASLRANYGIGVRIDINTIISYDVIMGDYSYVNRNASIENATIGKFCSISENVHISPWEHPLDKITTHPIAYTNSYRKRKRTRVIIGNDVLISLNVVILEGVKIGDGAVIAAGAVVTKDVEPYEIVGGVPATHIRYRFDNEKISELLQLGWWDKSLDEIYKIVKE